MRQIQYGNGTSTNYTYGQDLRLARIHTNKDSTNLQDLNYIFDKNGNITTLTDNLRSNIRAYVYDDLDRLTRAQNTPNPQGGYSTLYFQYDSIGNMTYKSDVGTMAYGVNGGPHAVTSAGGYNYQYDANGNMTLGKNKSLEYDVENRIIKVIQPDATTNFVYDGDGGRVKKSVTTSQGHNVTTYIGSLFEKNDYTDSGNQITQIKHIFAVAARVCSVKSVDNGPATADYYHSDHLGSSSVITDQNGQQVQHLEYAPYGSIVQNEGSDVTAYKFTGKELDSTGLYFYSARYYDPEIGRFVTPDTIVQAPYDPQSLNRYAYCRNNPLNYVDPSGHFWFIPAIIAIGKAIAVGAAIGSAIGGVIGGIGAAISGTSFWAGFGSGLLSGAISGAAGGAAWGVGAVGVGGIFGAKAMSFWGTKLALGAFSGASSGMAGAGFSGASISQGAMWGAVTGAAFTGVAISPVGQALGRGISKTGLGRFLNNVNSWVGSSYNDFIKSATPIASRINIRVEPADNIDPATGYRYVGPEEAAKAAKTGYAPNVDRYSKPKSVFYTPEEPLASASQAQNVYNLKDLPTHRMGLDTSKTTNIYGGNVAGGTGVEMITSEKIPVVDIQELGE
jgi:RHS repeat-associated protein